jgi:threonine dehydrogenase-like Zn-dependent dehydrogenase
MGANRAPVALPYIAVMVNCWRIVGTRACTRSDAREVLTMLDDGSLAIDDLITHRFPLAQADVAVAALQNRVEPIWMAVVNP